MSKVKVVQDIAVSGQYKITIKRPDNTVIETGWFDNMILNSGLDAMGEDVGFETYCFVGTGNTPVSATQTALSARQITTTDVSRNSTTHEPGVAPNYENTYTIVYNFPQGEVIGNITEVGIGPNQDGTRLFSRSLITNSSGTPTAISVVALDEFTVTYRLKLKPPVNAATGSFSVGSQTINYTARVGYAGNFGTPLEYFTYGFSKLYNAYAYDPTNLEMGDIESHTFGPNSAHVADTPAADLISNNTYVPGTYRRTGHVGWTYASGNNGSAGIGGVIVGYGTGSTVAYFKYIFNPPIQKSDTEELRLNMTYQWSRG